MTINDTWGYKSYDTNFKSTETLLRNLINIASKGGNYLLNIGPASRGVVPTPEVERLRQIGQWLRVNGEAIYDTQPTLFGAEAGAFSSTDKSSASCRRLPWSMSCCPRATESLCANAVSATPISINSGFSNTSVSSCPPSPNSHLCSGNSTLLTLTAKDLLIKLRKLS
jgi:Alpha-L-fucosidase